MASAEDAALLKEIAKLEKDILRSRKELGDPAIQVRTRVQQLVQPLYSS